ncbi:MAG: nitrogenase [Spirochaetales bacterium]|nr:nitrogenase [Spirochaetales bacterium]
MKEVTINTCNLCAPLGAAFAFKGIRKSLLLLHGSQGCSTYIRRYMIAHFREPVDIASSSFSENTAVFGGGENLKKGLDNIVSQYDPEIIGVATTCLSETIGDDVTMFIREYYKERPGRRLPEIILVSTPSYSGNYSIGFFKTQKALVESLSSSTGMTNKINVFLNILSPGDIRHLKYILEAFLIDYIMLPDYSDTLDGGAWREFHHIPPGGTTLKKIAECACSKVSLEFSLCMENDISTAFLLENKWNVRARQLPIPIGIVCTDLFVKALKDESGFPCPKSIEDERMRLVDAYADAHKYVFGKKVAIIGQEDWVYSLASFISEIGMIPVVCASGGKSGKMIYLIESLSKMYNYPKPRIHLDFDYDDMEHLLRDYNIDLILGSSKSYKLARALNIPLLRIGFPIHDRFGAAAALSIGYLGSRYVLNNIVNLFIEKLQNDNPVGYTYQ